MKVGGSHVPRRRPETRNGDTRKGRLLANVCPVEEDKQGPKISTERMRRGNTTWFPLSTPQAQNCDNIVCNDILAVATVEFGLWEEILTKRAWR